MRALVQVMVAVAVSMPLVASAQTVAGQQADHSRTGRTENAVTIVGCLVQGLPAADTAVRPSDDRTRYANDFFVRTPTVAVPPGSTVAVGKPGTASTATSAGTPTEDSYYRVTGIHHDQLRAHVGHRVELRGHLTPDPSAGEVTAAKTTVDANGRATTSVETRPAVAGVLHATAIEPMSEKCK